MEQLGSQSDTIEFDAGAVALRFPDRRTLSLSITFAAPSPVGRTSSDTAHVVYATCSGLDALASEWGPTVAIGITADPDEYVAWLNDVRYAGQPAWTADMFQPFDFDTGFQDYGALPLQALALAPGRVRFESHSIAVTLPACTGVADFARRLRCVMRPFEFEEAVRDPDFIGARFEAGRTLTAMPRFLREIRDGSEVYARARHIYLLDVNEAVERTLGAVACLFGEG
ncbi:MAG: hypothetical protein K2X57_29150 [Xanthobacteraceae bacterium]|nr:hypothetical protein [Xanthobacteraceae bacterium]